MPDGVELERFGYTPEGTFGRLRVADFECFTVERPWRSNAVGESCIPEGVYPMRMRRSGVVSRSSGGKYSRGWEVCDVPGRTYVMIHPANTIDDVEGCIGPGDKLGYVYGHWAVLSSRATFDRLMAQLAERNEWSIRIHAYHPQWP